MDRASKEHDTASREYLSECATAAEAKKKFIAKKLRVRSASRAGSAADDSSQSVAEAAAPTTHWPNDQCHFRPYPVGGFDLMECPLEIKQYNVNLRKKQGYI